jgi:hypothetical protein
MKALKSKDLKTLQIGHPIVVKQIDFSTYIPKEEVFHLHIKEIINDNVLMQDLDNKEFYTFNLSNLYENYIIGEDFLFLFYKYNDSMATVLKKQEENIKVFIKKEISKILNYNKIEKSSVIISGGFLCELICNYFYNTKINFNDIDLFVPLSTNNIDNATFLTNIKNTIPELEGLLNNFYTKPSANDYYNFTHDDFELLGSVKKEKINYIFIKTKSSFNKKRLLESFDLNCNEVSFSPKDNSLLYTYNFIDFISSKTLEIKQEQICLNSLIRLFKKNRELNFKTYKEEALIKTFFSLFFKYGINFSKSDKIFVDFISKTKRRNETNSFNHSLKSEEFIKEPLLNFFYNNPHEFFPYFELTENKIKFNKNNLPKNIKKTVETIDKANYYFLQFMELYKNINKEIFQEKEIVLKRLDLFTQNFSFLCKKKKNIYKLFPKIIKEDISINPKNIESFINQHDNIEAVIIYLLCEFDFSFKEINDFIKKINKNQILIGLLETLFFNIAHDLAKNIHYSYNKVDGLIAGLFEYIDKNRNEFYLIDPIDISYFSLFVKELTSSIELELEGKYMRHCVGGYSYKVKNQDCRIFHIKTNKGGHSTLELSDSFDIIQHKAPSNKDPHNLNKIIAYKLSNYLKFNDTTTEAAMQRKKYFSF